MSIEEYLSLRLNSQIEWYNKKGLSNKLWFNGLRVMEISLALCIPFLSSFSVQTNGISLLIGLFGIIIAVISSLLSLFNFQENWIDYRKTCESLKHEKFLFLTKADPYKSGDPDRLFVRRVEKLISDQNNRWAMNIEEPEK